MYKSMTAERKNSLDIANITVNEKTGLIVLTGEWTWVTINENLLQLASVVSQKEITIDGCSISRVDTTGMYFIHKLCDQIKRQKNKLIEVNLAQDAKKLFDLTDSISLEQNSIVLQEPEKPSVADKMASTFYELWIGGLQLLTYFGYLCYTLATIFKKEYSLYVRGIVETISSAGLKGIFITSSLCFLIGVNLTYQMAPQFVTYGANVFVVNFLGISLLREVTPLLTAIIVAGRTGSAITATIGTMKVQEEIDALQTMGISPMRRLVVPRVIGLLISLPILTMFADVASMAGGMIFAGPLMGVYPDLFLSRLQTYVSINNFWIGIFKSFFFAWIIAMVGCHRGAKVKSNADSIGVETTRSVVISICLIIFVDALFAILFKVLGVK